MPLLNTKTSDLVKSYLQDKSKKVAIITHVNPDGDAIGSSLGLFEYLKNIGFLTVSPVVPNDYASFLKWMPGNREIINANDSTDSAEKVLLEADVIFCLDFNHPDRSGKLGEVFIKTKAIKVLIDHHPQPEESFFDLVISDTEVSSTAELLFILINSIDNDLSYINTNVATCLFAGILTDTGAFSYASNNPQTYIIAASLIEKGVNALDVNRKIYDTYSENRLRLLGYCLSDKLTVLPNKKVAYISLSKKELEKYGHKEGDTEGVVNYALSIEGIELAAFFMENNDEIKISLRSRHSIDVNKIARTHFNGGGHVNASGGRVKTGLKDAIAKFEKIFESDNIINNT